MGLVTDYVVKLVERQVDEKGIVVWSDPAHSYASLANNLTLPNTRVVRFHGSYLALRHEVDSLLNDISSDTPPRLVIYVPGDLSTAEHALDEFVMAGVVMQPGEPALRNTNLEGIVKRALKTVLAEENVESIAEQVRKRQITSLAELDRLAEQGAQVGMGALSLIFGTGQPAEVALEFLVNPAHDQDLDARSATWSLVALLNEAFGSSLPSDEKPEALRARFRKYLLITEFRMLLQGEPPASLETVEVPEKPIIREACLQLVRTWRNRRDLQASYVDAARRVEMDYGPGTLREDWQALQDVETFPTVEESLQTSIEEALIDGANPELLELAEKRKSGFWAELEPNVRARWMLIATTAYLLRESDQIETALKKTPPRSAADYIERYTTEPHPWCQLDTYHRVLERLALNIDFNPQGKDTAMERLLARARQQYAATADTLAQRFVRSLAAAQFTLGGLTYQTEIFAREIAPFLSSEKTAYILVDGLRYEMARDLRAGLSQDWETGLAPAIGTAPTITPVGMAALLPGAERGVTLVDAGGGRVALEFRNHCFKERKERIEYLKQQIAGLYEVRLEALVPAKRNTREAIQAAKFVLVTSQEIDLLGEGDSIAQAREFMDSALGKLARAFRVLVDLGVQRIVVAADHGYIFAEELDTPLSVPAPGGQTADLHRRVWIGKGGHAHENVLRVSARELNLGGDLELATPFGLAGFSAGGGRGYLHGGLSLQELIIPVLVIRPAAAAAPVVSAQIEWSLTPGSAKLATRFFSVTIGGKAVGMFELVPPRVRVEIRARNRSVSLPVTASYGFQEATGEIELRRKSDEPNELEPNTVALRIIGEIDQKAVSVLLIDSRTDQTLKKLEVEANISI
jgi:PglZ domain